MSLSPRLVAIQGIGLSPIALAVQGFLSEVVTVVAPARIFTTGSAARGGGGPDAQLSLSDYLRKFGDPAKAAPVAAATQTSVQRAAQRRKKRQRMEEEILLLCTF